MALGGGLATQARHLVGGFLLLVQTLSRLTAAELRANTGKLRGPLLALLAAMGLLLTALTLLLVAGVLALAAVVGPVAACAIVALAAALAGWALARHGLSRLEQVDLAPRQSMATLQTQIDRFTRKPARAPRGKPNP